MDSKGLPPRKSIQKTKSNENILKTKLEVKIIKTLDITQNDKKSLPNSSSSTPKKPNIMNVYSRQSLHSPPRFDEIDTINEFQNIYNQKQKDSMFEIGLSRIETNQENIMLGSGFALSGFLDSNGENIAMLKVVPCFLDEKNNSSPKLIGKSSKISHEDKVTFFFSIIISFIYKATW